MDIKAMKRKLLKLMFTFTVMLCYKQSFRDREFFSINELGRKRMRKIERRWAMTDFEEQGTNELKDVSRGTNELKITISSLKPERRLVRVDLHGCKRLEFVLNLWTDVWRKSEFAICLRPL
ncbi:hypothetical protein Aduo_014674 [Ancylostoma duodenale]